MYYEEKKSLPEIARYLGYTPSGIHKIMIRHNLLRRTISESKIGKTLSLEHKQNIGDSGRGLKWTEEQKRQVRGIYHWNWKGGRKKDMGYIMIYNPEHPHNHHFRFLFSFLLFAKSPSLTDLFKIGSISRAI